MIPPGSRSDAPVKPKSHAARLFLRGLALVLPLLLTLALLLWVWNFLSGTIFTHVDSFVRWSVERLVPWTSDTQPTGDISTLIEEMVPEPLRLGISVAVSVLLVLLLGWWFSGFLGRRAVVLFERGLSRVPFISAIYPHVKQVVDFFLGGDDRKLPFDRVVVIPYPRQGLYSLGFLTGGSLRALNQVAGQPMVSVFIPSSPMPMTGYTLFVPLADLVVIDMTVDEALRTVVSGGVLIPAGHAEEVAALASRLDGGERPEGGEEA